MADATTDSFKAWHTWYKNNAQVTSMDEPQVIKDSCENPDEIINATGTLSSWYTDALETFYGNLNNAAKENKKMETELKVSLTEQLTTYFEDTLCEFYDELTPIEIVQSFHEAIKRNFTLHTKEFNKAKELLEFVDKININA
tara:strand:+ start:1718 stop:2143 length:426 start_codon:yes stop_codon:yes gene_type:complete